MYMASVRIPIIQYLLPVKLKTTLQGTILEVLFRFFKDTCLASIYYCCVIIIIIYLTDEHGDYYRITRALKKIKIEIKNCFMFFLIANLSFLFFRNKKFNIFFINVAILLFNFRLRLSRLKV